MSDANGEIGIAPGGFPLGMLPSPTDERDYRYPTYGKVFRSEELPEEYTCPDFPAAVDNQGAVSSCVAHALGIISDWRESRELKRPWEASRQYIYANRPDSWDHHGPGMVPRFALNNLRKYGVPQVGAWPGITEYGKETWPADRDLLATAAAPHHIDTYVGVHPMFVPEIKSALITTGPILYCAPIYSNFVPDSRGIIPMPSGTLRGGHGMALYGYKRDLFRVRNSWGAGWGQNGDGWMPWQYPALEVWGITDAVTRRQRLVRLNIGSKTIYVDGKPVELDVSPFIKDGRTWLPVRGIAEGLGAVVDYGPKDAPVEWVTVLLEESPW